MKAYLLDKLSLQLPRHWFKLFTVHRLLDYRDYGDDVQLIFADEITNAGSQVWTSQIFADCL